jgi:hypothetical protein
MCRLRRDSRADERPLIVGPSDPQAAYPNEFSGNDWSDNAIANIADFSGYGSSESQNTFGSPNSDSCEPTGGGSATFNGYTDSTEYWAC